MTRDRTFCKQLFFCAPNFFFTLEGKNALANITTNINWTLFINFFCLVLGGFFEIPKLLYHYCWVENNNNKFKKRRSSKMKTWNLIIVIFSVKISLNNNDYCNKYKYCVQNNFQLQMQSKNQTTVIWTVI